MKRCFWSLGCVWLFSLIGIAQQPPVWVSEQTDETLARFEAWKGDDLVVVFPYVTDIHSRRVDLDLADVSDPKVHVTYALRAAEKFHADFFADLGDIELEMVPKNNEEIQIRLASQEAIYQNATLPVVFSMGNHDHGKGRVVSSADYGKRFNGLAAKRGITLVLGPDSDYGYYDVPGKKCRVFFLNTSDDGYYGYSREQLQFVADNLRMEEGWTAVVVQHFCVQTEIGHWKSLPDTKARRQDLFLHLVEAFVAGQCGEEDGVRWDFTSNRNTRFAGCFFGDSHFDHHLFKNGVAYTISQGYGGISLKELPDDRAVVTPFNRSRTMLVDVVAIKPEKRQVKIFRIGAGGKDRDREYTY
ncbi:MAG: hypothetical protein Q4D98_02965 [Planctomycetia bacterium]|nr:hypothetical protein [Planctomycetia bacterium]